MPESVTYVPQHEKPTKREIDVRAAPRHLLARRPPIRVLMRPSFKGAMVLVRDISTRGICLLAGTPIQQGSRLALPWEVGPETDRRTVLARVVHTTRLICGDWIMGCAFDEPLTNADIIAFLTAAEESRPPRR
jgi:hypothetical protein